MMNKSYSSQFSIYFSAIWVTLVTR